MAEEYVCRITRRLSYQHMSEIAKTVANVEQEVTVAEVRVIGSKAMARHLRALADDLDPPQPKLPTYRGSRPVEGSVLLWDYSLARRL